MAKVKFMLEEASNRRGCLVELPWSAGEASFVLTCQWDKSVEQPVWTLYDSHDGKPSKVVWTQSFAPSDLEFMYDILVMSAPKNTGLASAAIPDLLKPTHNPEPEEEISYPSPHDVSPFPSMPAPMPQAAIPPPPGPTTSFSEVPAYPGHTASGAHAPFQAPQYQAPVPNPYAAPLPSAPMPGVMPGMPGSMPGAVPGAMPGMPGSMPGSMPGAAMPGMAGAPLPGMPAGYPYPGQPVYQQAHYPPQMAPQNMPQPMQMPAYQVQPQAEPVVPVDYHLLNKRSNVLLGTMLQEAGLISEPTLEAALKLQELVREDKMAPERAPHVLKRLHAMGGKIDQYLTPEDTMVETKKPAPAAPKAQPTTPAAQSSADGAAAGAPAKRNLKPAFDLLQTAGILSEEDIKVALEVRKKHGGDLVGILEAAGKVSRKTVDAAFICLPLIREGLLKVEQCIIALNYCSRMRVGFDEALDEMGWQNPRKLRSDLPL